MTVLAPELGPAELPWREQKKLLTRRALHVAARRMVLDAGLGAVTVDGICAEATVSPRTFFNYFPSKAAAALGLPELAVPLALQERFLASTGDLLTDLCAFLADLLDAADEGLSDRRSRQELIERRPEVRPELMQWLGGARRRLLDLTAGRTSPDRARAAVALVLAALDDAIERGRPDGAPLRERLSASLASLCSLAAECSSAAASPRSS